MSSPFMAEVIAAAEVIDGIFAKSFQLLPRIKAADRNAPILPDAARTEVVFLGVLHTPKAKPLITNAYDARTDQRPGTMSQHPLLRISPNAQRVAADGSAIVLIIQAEDIVLDLDQGARWRVSSARTTTFGTRECVVELL